MSIKLTASRQQGFTLLEIVLVLFLLGLMASSTLFLTQNVEDQAKYDETKNRLKMIRTAIIGDTSRTINGRPEISGFATDMGRLPECLRELLTRRLCDDSADLPEWEQNPESQVWAGWRGPYLTGNSEISGEVHFRDGYGNSGDTSGAVSDDWQNSGWDLDLTTTVGAITITSIGFDITDTVDDVIIEKIISAADYQVTLGADWQDIDIAFTNKQSTHIVIEQDELRLRLNTPLDGVVLNYADDEFDTATERNASTEFSRTFPSENKLLLSASGTMEVANTETLTFVPNATITTGTPNDSITLTSGKVVTYTDSANVVSKFILGSNCTPECTLLLPTTTYSLTNSPQTLTFNASATLTLHNYYLAPLTADNLAKPSIEVPVGTALSTDTVTLPLNTTITLPSSTATIVDTIITFEGTEIIISEPFTLSDTLVVTDSSDTFLVPVGSSLGSTTNSILIPATTIVTGGAKSFSVLCESTGSPYDGDCSTTGNHQPISMTLIPRKTLPVNTSPLEWVIQ
jgi:prepilin-type N-terminal cleavage/methylation domain-containing protein